MNDYNFDQIINRRGTYSIKWDLFGEEVLPLWVADMDFASPDVILNEIRTRLDHPIFGYQNRNPEVLDVICKWVDDHYQWRINPEDILLLPGVVTGFNWVANIFTGDGQSIIFQTPVYHPFYKVSGNNHFDQITVPLKNTSRGYQIDYDEFHDRIRDDTRVFILCNPHNPVGKVFKRKELEKLAEICLAHGILICSDEIHCDLIFPGHTHIPIASISREIAQNSITLMAPSKTFNIPGLHFSFAVIQNESIRERLKGSRNDVIGIPNILAQSAAKAAYKFGGDWLEELLKYLVGNRQFVDDFIRERMPELSLFSPEGMYLAWLDCSNMPIKISPFEFFLENAKVALNDGKIFGEGYEMFARLNFGCPRSILEEALVKMEAALQKVR